MAPTRRDFLKTTLAAGAVAQLGVGAVDGATLPGAGPGADVLPRRVLGRTGQHVTILGLGCAYLAGGTEAETRATIEAALEGGVRYFDTAPEYGPAGLSETRMGPALKSVRDQIFLTTKVDFPDAKSAEENLRRSLQRLQTDHVDLLLQHGVGLDGKWSQTDTMLAKGGSLEFLRRAKEKGLTRFIGMSVHPPHEPGIKLLEAADELDVVMSFVNYVSRAKTNTEAHIIEPAHRKGLGIIGMKVLGGSGQMADDYDRAFRYALTVPGVGCVIIGVKNVEEVRRAVRAAKEFRPLTAAEMDETIRLGTELLHKQPNKAALLQKHELRDCGGDRVVSV